MGKKSAKKGFTQIYQENEEFDRRHPPIDRDISKKTPSALSKANPNNRPPTSKVKAEKPTYSWIGEYNSFRKSMGMVTPKKRKI